MVQQADSIQTDAALEAESQQQVLRQHSSQLTPKEVLSWLPKNATPAQQDSMIRAHIKPSEIHWSEMPDTLHLPGHEAGKSFRDVSLPQYYRESFFSKDSLFHPELKGGRLGVAGDPVPYTVAGDSFITSLLLVCFLLACIAFSKSKHFVIRQAKTFFRTPRIPVLLRVADLSFAGNRVFHLFESIYQRYVYRRPISGNQYICWLYGGLFLVEGVPLCDFWLGIL